MSTIQIILDIGVIACTKKQKQTVIGLGLKGRHSVNTLKDTPAIRGMVNKISHLARIIDKPPVRNPWAALPAQYELGTVKPKAENEKKAAKKIKVASEGNNEAKPQMKAAGKSSKSKAPVSEKKTKTSSKKVKGK